MRASGSETASKPRMFSVRVHARVYIYIYARVCMKVYEWGRRRVFARASAIVGVDSTNGKDRGKTNQHRHGKAEKFVASPAPSI